MNVKSLLFTVSLSLIMMGCTNSSSSSSEEDTVFNSYCSRVAIVDTDVDFYMDYGKGISKCCYQLSPGVYPVSCEEDDMLGIGVGQDGGYIKMSDCKVETWRAEDGHGYVLPFTDDYSATEIPVRISPNDTAEIIDTLTFDKSIGEPCLGRENGWLKITINKKTGYVKEDEGTWCIHVFDYCGMIR